MANQPPKAGPLAAEWVQRDDQVISPSYTRGYPFVMDHGRGCDVWDVDGKRYLDLTAGIAVTSTGHSHPRVVKAIQEQAEKFLHMSGTDFYYPLQIRLAERLAQAAPFPGPARVFFTNSGAESIEAAFKLSRWKQHRPRMLAYIGAFHGRTMGAMSLSAAKYIHRKGFAPEVPGVTHIPYPYCYRCPLGHAYPSCELACVDYIEKTVFRQLVPPDEVAALFLEPIQGEGGYIVPPDGYFAKLKTLMKKYDILLVADEVQSGMGRTGKMFASEHWDIQPDIVACAKGIASGLPLGAIIARRDVMSWPPGAHANTFGGNPLACAAALVTIDLLEEEMIANAARQGAYLKSKLIEMQAKHPSIGDVRGIGLMVGAELVKDKATKEPAPALRDAAVDEAFNRGVLLLGCGQNTVRFMPALNVVQGEVDEGLAVFDQALTAMEKAML